MYIANCLEVGACAISLGIYARTAQTYFTAPEGIPPRARIIGVLFICFAGVNLWILSRVRIDWPWALASLLLYSGALCIFCAAQWCNRDRRLTVAFYADQPRHLVIAGPYRYIRHPFYASYCLTWFAGAVGSRSGGLGLISLLMTFVYLWAARVEEQKFLRSALASEYGRYRAVTGVFFPRFRRPNWRSAGRSI